MTNITWTDAAHGTAGHVDGKLVVQIRRLIVGGWSAGWRNGMTWDVSDQLQQVAKNQSRHFGTRELAKAAIESALGLKRRGRPVGSTLPEDERKEPVVRARVTVAQAEKFAQLGGADWLRRTIDRARI